MLTRSRDVAARERRHRTRYDSPEFIALRRDWYAKLAASGFEDAEEFDGSRFIKRGTHATRRAVTKQAASLRGDYYRRAGQWLWERVWPSRLERRCWEYHSEGMSTYHGLMRRALGNHRGYTTRLILDRLARERTMMGDWLRGLPERDPDAAPRTAFDQEVEGFEYIATRGEGRGSGG